MFHFLGTVILWLHERMSSFFRRHTQNYFWVNVKIWATYFQMAQPPKNIFIYQERKNKNKKILVIGQFRSRAYGYFIVLSFQIFYCLKLFQNKKVGEKKSKGLKELIKCPNHILLRLLLSNLTAKQWKQNINLSMDLHLGEKSASSEP